MTNESILFIVLAGVLAIGLSVFMYAYKTRFSESQKWIFGSLRFLSLFALFLLIINPKFRSETYSIEKPKLPVLLDNSASVLALDQRDNLAEVLNEIKGNADLNEKFDVRYYSFGSNLVEGDTVSFSDRNTNIAGALATIKEVYKSEIAPTVLITDGNQTLGADYEFGLNNFNNAIYPVVLGDTVRFSDLKIERLNTNRYAFLKNDFPVEVFLTYEGEESINTRFTVTQGGRTVFSENISMSERDDSRSLSFTLPAQSVGLQRYTASLQALSEERNTANNSKQFAVEVIDQSTNVLVVSKVIHPDLGALRKAIETNEQRKISFVKPADINPAVLNENQLIILYQPDRSFSNVYRQIATLRKNTWTITGRDTDWSFLNSAQDFYQKEVMGTRENISAELNLNYSTFGVEDIGFDDFPPLETRFGDLFVLVPHEILLSQIIDGITTGSPLLATIDQNGIKQALMDGEGLWKWRARSFVESGDFIEFDTFIGKLVQYLASEKRRSRLEVSNESFYYNNNLIRLTAQYFDQNYVFDSRSSLVINLTNSDTDERIEFPMLLRNNFYEVDLNSLPAGEYNYTVSVLNEEVARSGQFTILDFNVEQQFLNADVTKLQRVATNTGGNSFFPIQSTQLVQELLDDSRYQPIQKSEQKVVPLIDWKYLLAILVLTLAAEWFIRKYNGLI